uniref:RING-type E3 ubiquitin transferase n=1 Tax=Nelumbo nucifera TaxID=4432 RepID=A0A822XJ74_NELNU|nr:TPA_asm: hypothetical protein HUJ06_020664 [Nelumbo nucifera]
MGATAIQVVALFFCLFFSSATAAARANELCSSSMCGDNGLTVRFPFRIKAMQRQQHCGYPGFDLSCSSNLGKTILKLPFSGGFWVKKIDYVRQEIRIGDPGNCLPRRLLHLNLSGSPFKGEFYQTYQFFNCSSDFPGFQFDYIPCLSSSTHMVFATSYIPFAGYVPATCDLISTVSIPVVWQEDYESNFGRFPLFELSNELQLTWDSPNCGDCEARDGKCGFMTNSTLETGCFDVPRREFQMWAEIRTPSIMDKIRLIHGLGRAIA